MMTDQTFTLVVYKDKEDGDIMTLYVPNDKLTDAEHHVFDSGDFMTTDIEDFIEKYSQYIRNGKQDLNVTHIYPVEYIC